MSSAFRRHQPCPETRRFRRNKDTAATFILVWRQCPRFATVSSFRNGVRSPEPGRPLCSSGRPESHPPNQACPETRRFRPNKDTAATFILIWRQCPRFATTTVPGDSVQSSEAARAQTFIRTAREPPAESAMSRNEEISSKQGHQDGSGPCFVTLSYFCVTTGPRTPPPPHTRRPRRAARNGAAATVAPGSVPRCLSGRSGRRARPCGWRPHRTPMPQLPPPARR